jgi:ornithine decarboxylase
MSSKAMERQNLKNPATIPEYPDVPAMLVDLNPSEPVYCIYPDYYRREVKYFLNGFPGRVLYAVKANDEPEIVRLIHQAGVRHFDCASLDEIALVHQIDPGSTTYFMTPVRLRGAAQTAQRQFGTRHFMIDHPNGLEPLADEIDMKSSVVFARMAVHHDAAMLDLSVRFGAPPTEIPRLLTAIKDTGAEPALAFNVGSSVIQTAAYTYGIGLAADALARVPFQVRLLDIGGGYPRSYPGFQVPPLEDYFAAVSSSRPQLPLADNGELMAEPGRALAAPGLSAVVEVILRKDDRLYINDGMYGIFWELRFKGHDRYPVRAYRQGRVIGGDNRNARPGGLKSFRLYGPTCDSTDALPGMIELPHDIQPGDYLEFGFLGAYSLAGRTRFNGFYSETLITVTDPGACQPGDT